jgi:hypothetical protein
LVDDVREELNDPKIENLHAPHIVKMLLAYDEFFMELK